MSTSDRSQKLCFVIWSRTNGFSYTTIVHYLTAQFSYNSSQTMKHAAAIKHTTLATITPNIPSRKTDWPLDAAMGLPFELPVAVDVGLLIVDDEIIDLVDVVEVSSFVSPILESELLPVPAAPLDPTGVVSAASVVSEGVEVELGESADPNPVANPVPLDAESDAESDPDPGAAADCDPSGQMLVELFGSKQ